ncbi:MULTISPECIES: restriction endonuclease subunit S [unclassified Microcoleus]|uniref:restriction endonuclease subunit S n=1 Tax=unclassified Microcoleus TaxID=2642155 RepID=UPI002FD1DD8F
MSKKVNRKVPKLRFSEFEGDWKFGEVSDLISSLDAGVSVNSEDRAANQVEKGILKTSCISNGVFNPTENKVVADEHELSRLKEPVTKNTILISRMNTPILVGANSYIEKDYPNLFLPDRLWAAKIKKINFPKWVSYYFIRNKVRGLLSSRATGTSNSMKNITKNDVLTLPVYFPLIPEQEKIASFLGAVDTRLTQLRRKHELLQTYKRGVMQKIFSQQIRFKGDDGKPFPDWETNRIDNFLVRYNNPVHVQLDAEYSQIGIRSHGKGIFHKEPVTGRDLGNKRVYWVHPRSFVINIVFAWEQAVALTSNEEDGFIASHRFLMFLPKNNKVNLQFVLLFFLGNRGKSLLELASPGGAGRNKTLGQQNFSELQVTFPTLKEQEKIADFLTAIDKKMEAVAKQINLTEQFKKGLLQKMFV